MHITQSRANAAGQHAHMRRSCANQSRAVRWGRGGKRIPGVTQQNAGLETGLGGANGREINVVTAAR